MTNQQDAFAMADTQVREAVCGGFPAPRRSVQWHVQAVRFEEVSPRSRRPLCVSRCFCASSLIKHSKQWTHTFVDPTQQYKTWMLLTRALQRSDYAKSAAATARRCSEHPTANITPAAVAGRREWEQPNSASSASRLQRESPIYPTQPYSSKTTDAPRFTTAPSVHVLAETKLMCYLACTM